MTSFKEDLLPQGNGCCRFNTAEQDQARYRESREPGASETDAEETNGKTVQGVAETHTCIDDTWNWPPSALFALDASNTSLTANRLSKGLFRWVDMSPGRCAAMAAQFRHLPWSFSFEQTG